MTELEWIKSRERPEALVLVVDDADAKKILIAWTNYFPSFHDQPYNPETKPFLIMRRWCDVRIEWDRIARLSGVPARTAQEKFYRMQMAHLVFPDGTVSEEAMKIVSVELSIRVAKLAEAQEEARAAKAKRAAQPTP